VKDFDNFFVSQDITDSRSKIIFDVGIKSVIDEGLDFLVFQRRDLNQAYESFVGVGFVILNINRNYIMLRQNLSACDQLNFCLHKLIVTLLVLWEGGGIVISVY